MNLLKKLSKLPINTNNLTKIDGFDEAIIGISFDNRLIYDMMKMVQILEDRDGTGQIDAIEHIFYNIIGSFQFNNPPIIVSREE